MKQLFSFTGRMNRAPYFGYALINSLVANTLMAIKEPNEAAGLAILTISFASILGGIVLMVKRLHDIDRPGWHWLLGLIPLYNIYFGLVLLFQRGTAGVNQYGDDPLLGA